MTASKENSHITIEKSKTLPKAQDYYYLRSEGIRLIEKLGSRLWTDYNIHDPGITLLETLCYAITDLSYRSSFEVKDLIAEEKPGLFNPDMQALYTAREILTTAPWTINDYRKLLIDLDEIRNAWIMCNKCDFHPKIYIDCKNSTLTYKKTKISKSNGIAELVPKGLYNVLLELDKDEQNGDLNTGKVNIAYNMLIDNLPETLYLEVRFPSSPELDLIKQNAKELAYFRYPGSSIVSVNARVISDKQGAQTDINESMLITALRSNLYVTFEITYQEYITNPSSPKNNTLIFKDVPFRFAFLKTATRQKLTLKIIRDILNDNTGSGVASRFLLKIQAIDQALDEAKKALYSHRNVAEDFCNVDVIEIEEIGICSDIELSPDADIEKVLSEVFYLIEEYLNPSVKFHTLAGMLEKMTVDEIFDGPKLAHGFIDDDDLKNNTLNRTLYSSDIINLVMDISGVLSVKNFVLIRFDKEGNKVSSDTWKLEVSHNHLPRFYLEGSKILVFKNGLPFLPDVPELIDTLQVVRGRNVMPKLNNHDLDVDVPSGDHYQMNEYRPVQNSLPLVYGTGYEGLPSNATEMRKAQAKQLKAYLVFFEQLLVNYLGQLSNLKYLFSLDNKIRQTYFPVYLDDKYLKNGLYNNVTNDFYIGFDENKLQEITESKEEFQERRNRFLDHLLARFSESFSDYALLLYSYKSEEKITGGNLIRTKTSFLKQFPYQSAYKAQSFDYTSETDIEIRKDLSGIHHRISAFLGLQKSLNYFEYVISRSGEQYSTSLDLFDDSGNRLLALKETIMSEDRDEVVRQLNFYMTLILKDINEKTNYTVKSSGGKYTIELGFPAIATGMKEYNTQAEALQAIDDIVEFADEQLNDERFIIVEHILLRPRESNDELLPVCLEPDCSSCGEEDPYSYKLTFVFDGESDLAKKHFNFRRYAETVIRSELPAHILAKICWVEHDTFVAFEDAYCKWLSASETDKSNELKNLIAVFRILKSIYPSPTLHDCIDGNDENRVFLNQTQL